MSNAVPSFQTLLRMADSGGTNYATIAELTNIGGLDMTATIQKVTSHSSVEAAVEKLATMIDYGQIPIEFNHIPSDPTHDDSTGLLAVFAARAKRNYEIVFVDGATTTWGPIPAYIGKLKMGEAPVDGVYKGTATLEVTGKPTFTS